MVANARQSEGSSKGYAEVNVLLLDPEHVRRSHLKDTVRGIPSVHTVLDRGTTEGIAEVLQGSAVDVVFVDVGGDRDTAGRIGEALRRAKETVRLVHIADQTDEETRGWAAEVGFHACLAKPYDIGSVEHTLMAAAGDLLEERQSRYSPEAQRNSRIAAYLEKLRQIRLFQGFSDAQLVRLLRICKARRFEQGATIFSEGDQGQHFYVILSGTVRIVLRNGGQERELTTFSAGEVFGEMAVVDDSPRSADAVAGSDSVVLELTRELMDREGDPIAHRLIRHISGLLAGKLRAASQ